MLHRYGGKVIKGSFQGNFSCFDMLMNIAPAAILAWVSILINLTFAVLCMVNGMDVMTVLLSITQSLVNLCCTMFALGLLTTLTEWKQINCSPHRKLLFTLTFPVFMLTYLPVTVAALTCKPDWKPIAHSRHISMGELADSRTERSA